MLNRFVQVYAVVAVLAGTALSQLTIDATGPIRPRMREATTVSGGGVARKLPLLLTVQSEISAPDANGKRLVKFILTNSGTKPLSLPTSPHPGDFEPADTSPSYSVMTLGLRVSRSDKPGVIFSGGADLYGGTSLPSTLVDLPPGGSIHVLARVSLPDSGSDAFVATASLDKETLKTVGKELIMTSEEIGYARSRDYTIESIPHGHQ